MAAGCVFSRISRHMCIPLLVLAFLPAGMAPGQQKSTMLMSVLNSRQHQWGKDDNPVIGIFGSSDAGVTWQHRGWREYIRTFYTEAGPDGTIWSACGNGVLRSTDGGASWRVTTGWDVTEVLKVKVDPSSSRRVYGATAYGLIASTDRGETWRYRMHGVARRFTSDVCIDRRRPQEPSAGHGTRRLPEQFRRRAVGTNRPFGDRHTHRHSAPLPSPGVLGGDGRRWHVAIAGWGKDMEDVKRRTRPSDSLRHCH